MKTSSKISRRVSINVRTDELYVMKSIIRPPVPENAVFCHNSEMRIYAIKR